MIQYFNGMEARVGDKVSLAHRAHTGVVIHVLENAVEYQAWSLDGPGLMIDTSYAGLVFYARDGLSCDEIELLARG